MHKLLISKKNPGEEKNVSSAFLMIELNQPNNVLKYNIAKAEH